MQLIAAKLEQPMIGLQAAAIEQVEFAFDFYVIAGGNIEFTFVDELSELFDLSFSDELPVVVQEQEVGSLDAIEQGIAAGAEANIFREAEVADVGARRGFETIVAYENLQFRVVAPHAADQAIQVFGPLKGFDDGGCLREQFGAVG
jgi:hypothetical protein